jgi:peptide/nickel transport system ATP-binding protein
VLRLLDELQDERGMAMVFVTHDLGVVAEIADRVVVMYAGKVMESGPVHDIFENPSHPYTKALLKCLPGRGEALETIGGSFPDPTDPPEGCRFHGRCPYAIDQCKEGDQPVFHGVGDGHEASCVLHGPDHKPPLALEVDDD